ncbi:hypothetical protein ABZP36_000880 [Zizania latifolia]
MGTVAWAYKGSGGTSGASGGGGGGAGRRGPGKVGVQGAKGDEGTGQRGTAISATAPNLITGPFGRKLVEAADGRRREPPEAKLKTSVKKRSVNPIWHEELTLSITNPVAPIKLEVFDKDTFSRDDPMGEAEIELGPLMEVLNMDPENIWNGTIVRTIDHAARTALLMRATYAGGMLDWSNFGSFASQVC